jgi:DnaK suppressor protein
MATVRYSDEELEEFRQIINEKLEKARKDYDSLIESMDGNEDNDITDTSPSYKNLSESASLASRQETAALAARQLKFIKSLEAALVRIENKTYGVCRITGKLIPKERLRAVPHATLSVEAKNAGYK